ARIGDREGLHHLLQAAALATAAVHRDEHEARVKLEDRLDEARVDVEAVDLVAELAQCALDAVPAAEADLALERGASHRDDGRAGIHRAHAFAPLARSTSRLV